MNRLAIPAILSLVFTLTLSSAAVFARYDRNEQLRLFKKEKAAVDDPYKIQSAEVYLKRGEAFLKFIKEKLDALESRSKEANPSVRQKLAQAFERHEFASGSLNEIKKTGEQHFDGQRAIVEAALYDAQQNYLKVRSILSDERESYLWDLELILQDVKFAIDDLREISGSLTGEGKDRIDFRIQQFEETRQDLQQRYYQLKAANAANWDNIRSETEMIRQKLGYVETRPGRDISVPSGTGKGSDMKNGELIGVLNKLVDSNEEAQKDFQTAAREMNSGELKTLFSSIADQRSKFVDELKIKIRQLGGNAEPGYGGKTVQDTWAGIRDGMTDKGSEEALKEAEEEEGQAKNQYEKALRQDLPPDIRATIERQYIEVRAAHELMSDLRDTVHDMRTQ